MFNKSYRSQAAMFGSAVLALTVSASSQAAFNLVPNGDFESGGDSWGVEPAGGASFAFPAAGGNTGGYLEMTGGGWGGVAISTDDPAGSTLASFGVVAGGTYDFQWDQKVFSGAGGGMGIKVESWSDTGVISDSTDQIYANAGTDWETFSYTYTIEAAATRLKIVLLGLNGDSVMGFDNVGIEGGTAPVPVPAAAWLFGSALAGLVAVRRKK